MPSAQGNTANDSILHVEAHVRRRSTGRPAAAAAAPPCWAPCCTRSAVHSVTVHIWVAHSCGGWSSAVNYAEFGSAIQQSQQTAHVRGDEAAAQGGKLRRLQLCSPRRREGRRQPQLVAAVQLPRHLPQRPRLQSPLLQRACVWEKPYQNIRGRNTSQYMRKSSQVVADRKGSAAVSAAA